MRVVGLAAVALLMTISASVAQAAAPGCTTAAAPATPPSPPPSQGSAAGTTGFTNGTGGSFVGTTQAGPDRASPSAQPVTAKGLDPIKGMPDAPKC